MLFLIGIVALSITTETLIKSTSYEVAYKGNLKLEVYGYANEFVYLDDYEELEIVVKSNSSIDIFLKNALTGVVLKERRNVIEANINYKQLGYHFIHDFEIVFHNLNSEDETNIWYNITVYDTGGNVVVRYNIAALRLDMVFILLGLFIMLNSVIFAIGALSMFVLYLKIMEEVDLRRGKEKLKNFLFCVLFIILNIPISSIILTYLSQPFGWAIIIVMISIIFILIKRKGKSGKLKGDKSTSKEKQQIERILGEIKSNNNDERL